MIRFYPVFLVGVGLLGLWDLWPNDHHLAVFACGGLIGVGWAALGEQGGVRSLFR